MHVVPEFRGSAVPGVLDQQRVQVLDRGGVGASLRAPRNLRNCDPEPRNLGTPEPRQYLHFLSLILVAVLMAIGLSPFRAVFWATIAAVALSVFGRPDERLWPRRLGGALVAGGLDMLPVLATTAVAGIIVGVVTLTGLGLKAAGLIVGLAGGSLPLTVVFAALAVWILGLAVPVTASYIISAVMIVPALDGRRGRASGGAHVHLLLRRVVGSQSADRAGAVCGGGADRRASVPHDAADLEVRAAGVRGPIRVHARSARAGPATPGELRWMRW